MRPDIRGIEMLSSIFTTTNSIKVAENAPKIPVTGCSDFIKYMIINAEKRKAIEPSKVLLCILTFPNLLPNSAAAESDIVRKSKQATAMPLSNIIITMTDEIRRNVAPANLFPSLTLIISFSRVI